MQAPTRKPFKTLGLAQHRVVISSRINVLPVALQRGIAVLGMLSMGGSGEIISKGAFTPFEALSYAMSLPVAATISGIDSMEVLDQNLAVLRDFKPLSADQTQ